MDNEHNTPDAPETPEQDQYGLPQPHMPDPNAWLDDLLTPPEHSEEIQAAEEEMYFAGLTHPKDAQVEEILREFQEQVRTEQDGAAPGEDVPPENGAPEEPAAVFLDEEYRDAFGDGEELQQILSGQDLPPLGGGIPPEDGTDNTEEPPPQPKRRPERRKGYGLLGIPHILVTLVWLAIVLAIGISLGRVLWLCASDVLAFNRQDFQATITIEKEDTVEDVANKLSRAGIIRYPSLFKAYVDFSHKADRISVGTFTLNSRLDYMALVNEMNNESYSREVVEVVVPEGYNCAQIFRLLESEKVCSAADLESWAASGELDDYWFLEGVERGDKYCLEGYLFPDTYQFYTDDEPRRVLEKFLDNFDYRFNDDMVASIDTLNQRLAEMLADNGYGEDYIEAHKFTIRELVIVASLIEEETANTLESYTISSVIYNRLTDPDEYPYLNIDATIIYALGEHKEELTLEDLQIDSPYNTYTRAGLTPGPISNPGLYSLNAALDPDDSDYHFYAMDPSQGAHHFSKTAAEHERFLESLRDD